MYIAQIIVLGVKRSGATFNECKAAIKIIACGLKISNRQCGEEMPRNDQRHPVTVTLLLQHFP